MWNNASNIRLIRGNDNYFVNTDEFTKYKNIKAKESSLCFEKNFLLNIIKKREITNLELQYLLNIQNYQYSNEKDFHLAFEIWRKKPLKNY